MYIINERLAVHGFDFNPRTNDLRATKEYFDNNGNEDYGFIKDWKNLRTGDFFDNEYVILDCRGISETENIKPIKSHYKTLIEQGNQILKNGYKVVCCCSAGQSRSSAIAIALLISYFKMDYYDAFNLVEKKNPIMNIAIHHLDIIKKILKVRKIP